MRHPEFHALSAVNRASTYNNNSARHQSQTRISHTSSFSASSSFFNFSISEGSHSAVSSSSDVNCSTMRSASSCRSRKVRRRLLNAKKRKVQTQRLLKPTTTTSTAMIARTTSGALSIDYSRTYSENALQRVGRRDRSLVVAAVEGLQLLEDLRYRQDALTALRGLLLRSADGAIAIVLFRLGARDRLLLNKMVRQSATCRSQRAAETTARPTRPTQQSHTHILLLAGTLRCKPPSFLQERERERGSERMERKTVPCIFFRYESDYRKTSVKH